jgi:isopentenyldiphosphate isomerase
MRSEHLTWLLASLRPGAVVRIDDLHAPAGLHVLLGIFLDGLGGHLMHCSPLRSVGADGCEEVVACSSFAGPLSFPERITGLVMALEPSPDGKSCRCAVQDLAVAAMSGNCPPLLGHLLHALPCTAPRQDGFQMPDLGAVLELVDIVDEEDRIIGCATRADAHAAMLRHRFVQVLVQRGNGAVLLQRRSMRKARGPGLFDASVGGHVDAGESYRVAMLREAGEEMGLAVDGDYKDIGAIVDFTPGVENMVGRLYLHRSEGPFVGWEEEADQLQWFSLEELARMTGCYPYLFTGGMLSAARLFLETTGDIQEQASDHQAR